jgi:hypothetical protein
MHTHTHTHTHTHSPAYSADPGAKFSWIGIIMYLPTESDWRLLHGDSRVDAVDSGEAGLNVLARKRESVERLFVDTYSPLFDGILGPTRRCHWGKWENTSWTEIKRMRASWPEFEWVKINRIQHDPKAVLLNERMKRFYGLGRVK